jgi:hypothetical protein
MSDTADATLSAGFEDYEKGKHRRYELLFKVNGAAFVIATLFTKTETKDIIQGVVSLQMLAIGMMAFTIIMGIDIFSFGWGMKQLDNRWPKMEWKIGPWRIKHTQLGYGLFRPVGMAVLGLTVALIALGWLLVALNPPSIPVPGISSCS